MNLAGTRSRLSNPLAVKLIRYSLTSVVAVAVSLVFLVFFNGVLGWGAVLSSTLATAIATVPSYTMNRRWAWGKQGRSHLMKEVLPFWVLAFMGWAFSTYSVKLMESYAKSNHFSHLLSTTTVAIVYVGAFGVLWVVKFMIFNKILFVHNPEDLPPALDGRTGLPG